MPMVELEVGGARRRVAMEPAARALPAASANAARTARATRCLAAFYDEPADAHTVADTLSRQFGLAPGQVTVIEPGEGMRRDFQDAARHWQAQRRGPGTDSLNRLTLSGVGAGVVAGTMLAVPVWLLAGGAVNGVQGGLWLLTGPLIGALAGALAASWVHARQPGQRFDETVHRKLRDGFSALVTHGLAPSQHGQVLAYLQGNSYSWCAEVTGQDKRL